MRTIKYMVGALFIFVALAVPLGIFGADYIEQQKLATMSFDGAFTIPYLSDGVILQGDSAKYVEDELIEEFVASNVSYSEHATPVTGVVTAQVREDGRCKYAGVAQHEILYSSFETLYRKNCRLAAESAALMIRKDFAKQISAAS